MAPKHIFFTIDLGYREFPVTYRSYLKSFVMHWDSK